MLRVSRVFTNVLVQCPIDVARLVFQYARLGDRSSPVLGMRYRRRMIPRIGWLLRGSFISRYGGNNSRYSRKFSRERRADENARPR